MCFCFIFHCKETQRNQCEQVLKLFLLVHKPLNTIVYSTPTYIKIVYKRMKRICPNVLKNSGEAEMPWRFAGSGHLSDFMTSLAYTGVKTFFCSKTDLLIVPAPHVCAPYVHSGVSFLGFHQGYSLSNATSKHAKMVVL